MTPRREPIGPLEWATYAALPLLLVSVLSIRQMGPILSGALTNPDTYMRLVRLRESLRIGEPAHEIMRDGSGLGTVVHWSHLIDSLLCLIALPLTVFVDEPTALHIAAIVFGPLNIAALGLAMAWAAAPFCERRWLWLAPLAACLGPAILQYGLAGVTHHHVACVIVAVMAAGWTARAIVGIAPRHAGWPLGAWAGVGIWLTPETLPLSVMAFGALWLTWVMRSRSPCLSRTICHTGQALLITTWLAWMVDPPFAGHAAEDIDRVSIVFVTLGAAIAATGSVVRALDEFVRRPIDRLLTSATAGAFFAMIWLTLFPGALWSPQAMMADETARILFRDIAEMASIESLSVWMNYLFTGCVAVLALAAFAIRARSPILLYAVLCGIVLIVLGRMHVRFASYPEALGAIMLPVVVSFWADRVGTWPEWRQPLPRMGTIILFLLVPFVSDVGGPLKQAQAANGDVDRDCPVTGLDTMLAPHAGQVVLTDVNKSPELQYRSEIVTVGSLYHRNPAGFMRLRAAWRSQDAEAVPPAFAVAGISMVLFCPTTGRSPLVRDLPETTLLDRLTRNEAPRWLEPVARDPISGHVLYRVRS